MPMFIPPTRPDDFNGSYGEEKVWDALATLDDRYTIFHLLRWVGAGATVGENEISLHTRTAISQIIETELGHALHIMDMRQVSIRQRFN